MTIEENHSRIWNYLKELQTGMLCTGTDGLLSSRPMHLIQNDYEGTIYLFAKKSSQKVHDIKKSPTVNFNFEDTDNNLYISLSGIASIETDGQLFQAFWNDDVKLWFSDSDTPEEDAVLIVMEITHADIWESKGNMFSRAFEFTKAKFSKSKPEIGKHETIEQ